MLIIMNNEKNNEKEYIIRVDRRGQYILCHICLKYVIEAPNAWYKHHPYDVTNDYRMTMP